MVKLFQYVQHLFELKTVYETPRFSFIEPHLGSGDNALKMFFQFPSSVFQYFFLYTVQSVLQSYTFCIFCVLHLSRYMSRDDVGTLQHLGMNSLR